MGRVTKLWATLQRQFFNEAKNWQKELFFLRSAQAFAFVGGLLVAMIGSTQVIAQDGSLQCTGNESEETMSCDFRLAENTRLNAYTLLINGKPPSEKSEFTPYRRNSPVSAWLFMLDRTDPARQQTVNDGKEMVERLLQNSNEKRLMGVATFTDELRMELPVAASHVQVSERLGAIKADGLATQFFSSVVEAINVLEKIQADRKGLVILSDGKAEDTAFSYEDVVKAAKEASVTVIGMGYAQSAGDTPALQGIRRLSIDTGGAYSQIIIGQQDFDETFINGFVGTLENGGVINASLKDVVMPVDVSLSLETTSGEVITLKETFDRIGLFGRDLDIPLIARIYSIFGADQSDWAKENQPIAWLLPIIVLLLLLGFLGFFILARRQPVNTEGYIDEPLQSVLTADGEDVAIAPPQPLIEDGTEQPEIVDPEIEEEDYGLFEVVGNEGTTYPIMAMSASIGRHTDNDIRLANTSVHRHHAHIHVSQDGAVTIQDLGYENGVLVNDEKVEKTILQFGDIVELGEVRLRFVKQ